MRDFSRGTVHLSINTATLRKQLDLASIVEACARRGIPAIDPWRDQVQSAGLDTIARQIRDAGLVLSGPHRAERVYVGGEPAVLEGQLARADEREIAAAHRVQAARFLAE